jgi:alpha-glucosidase
MTNIRGLDTIHHDGSPRYVRLEGRAEGATALLRLRAAQDAPIERVFLRTAPDGEQHIAPMRPAGVDATCRWWEVDLRLEMPRTSYRFLLLTSDGAWWLSAAGLTRHMPTDATDFKLLADHQAPDWLGASVFYQIFPDRFADGDPTNNMRSGGALIHGRPAIARRWGELPDRANSSREFFGGDLAGIVQKLDYLAELGVNALYLNPIFVSPSNHKYDVADYDHVDPHFGGDAALAELRSALDARGMRLILDITPNHSSANHPWFVAAQADPAAPTAEFYTFRKRPDDYATWLGVRSLPKLNYRSQRLREAMFAGDDSIMRRWLRPPYRIDGWRIDVANMLARQGAAQLGHKIGRAIRRAVKAEAPDAYLLGENFFDGTPHLQGDELDATMNYSGFTIPLWQWLVEPAKLSMAAEWATARPLATEALAAQWRAFMAAIPWQVVIRQFNLLNSHDTSRFFTLVDADVARVRVAATLLCTYPGVPSILYGDEVGLPGGPDPDCRRCMPWDEQTWNIDLREHYRALIRLRRTSAALREGGFQLLHAQGDTVAFQREANGERLLVVARRADDRLAALPVHHSGLADGTRLREYRTGAEATVAGGVLPLDGLGAVGAQIWIAPS